MYVNIAILKETEPQERRVALVPSIVARLTKLGARQTFYCQAPNRADERLEWGARSGPLRSVQLHERWPAIAEKIFKFEGRLGCEF